MKNGAYFVFIIIEAVFTEKYHWLEVVFPDSHLLTPPLPIIKKAFFPVLFWRFGPTTNQMRNMMLWALFGCQVMGSEVGGPMSAEDPNNVLKTTILSILSTEYKNFYSEKAGKKG